MTNTNGPTGDQTQNSDHQSANRPDGPASLASEPVRADGIGPLSCTPPLEHLYRLLDDDLDESQRARFASHLDECGCCETLLQFQAGFRQLVGMRCHTDPPPGLADRVFRSLSPSAPLNPEPGPFDPSQPPD